MQRNLSVPADSTTAPSTVGRENRAPTLARLAAAAKRETEALWSLDARPGSTALRGPELHARARRINLLRRATQVASLLFVVLVGAQFFCWVRGLEAGIVVGTRPPAVEGFLPISALLSLRHLFVTGVVHPVHPAGLVILLLVLAASLVIKKSFCSWLCPAGAISELLAGLSRRLFRVKMRLPRFLDLPLRSLKYLLLLFFAWAVFVQMTPQAVAAFLDAPYNRVADIKMLRFFVALSPFAAKVLFWLTILSLAIPYFWCRYLCPYGALLGITSLLAPWKVTRQSASCIDCNLCSRACPSHLPVARMSRVRSDECFGCFSCIAACPVPDALQMRTPRGGAVRPALLAAALLALVLGGPLVARGLGLWKTSVTNAEYLQRIHELERYDHLRGGAVPAQMPPGHPRVAAPVATSVASSP